MEGYTVLVKMPIYLCVCVSKFSHITLSHSYEISDLYWFK